jgi:eukaryotic-like serine/threonine-protein kinase
LKQKAQNDSIVIAFITTIVIAGACVFVNFYGLSVQAINDYPQDLTVQVNETSSTFIRTYENPILGVKFEYPLEWGEPSIRDNSVSFSSSSNSKTQFFDITISVETLPPGFIDLQQFMREKFGKYQTLPEFKIVELNKTTLAGFPALKLRYNYLENLLLNNVNVTSMNVFTIKGNTAYDILLHTRVSNYVFYLSEVQKLIDSFKIISILS